MGTGKESQWTGPHAARAGISSHDEKKKDEHTIDTAISQSSIPQLARVTLQYTRIPKVRYAKMIRVITVPKRCGASSRKIVMMKEATGPTKKKTQYNSTARNQNSNARRINGRALGRS